MSHPTEAKAASAGPLDARTPGRGDPDADGALSPGMILEEDAAQGGTMSVIRSRFLPSLFQKRGYTRDEVREAARKHRIDLGLKHCRAGRLKRGSTFLEQELEERQPTGPGAGVVLSWVGYARAQLSDRHREGLDLCKKALELEAYDPEVSLNLARVHRLMGDTRQAIQTLDRGLQFDPEHADLVTLREEMGLRLKPVLSFLPREHPINRSLGRLRHKLRQRWPLAARARSALRRGRR